MNAQRESHPANSTRPLGKEDYMVAVPNEQEKEARKCRKLPVIAALGMGLAAAVICVKALGRRGDL